MNRCKEMTKFYETSLKLQMRMLKHERQNSNLMRQVSECLMSRPRILSPINKQPMRKIEPANTPEELEALTRDENVVSINVELE